MRGSWTDVAAVSRPDTRFHLYYSGEWIDPGGAFSILLIDIDDFKQVNDRWGHAVGDDVLVKTASLFQSMIRRQDLVGRWGGEEFLIIVPGVCDTEALAECLRSEVAATEYRSGSTSFHITVSIGSPVQVKQV